MQKVTWKRNADGTVKSIESGLWQIHFRRWDWMVELDNVSYSAEAMPDGNIIEHSKDVWSIFYVIRNYKITWHYEIPSGEDFLKFHLEVEQLQGKKFQIGRIRLCEISTQERSDDIFDYWTMRNCPFAIIARIGKGSLIATSEIPMCDLTYIETGMAMAFDARLKIRKGESYVSEYCYLVPVRERTHKAVGRWLPKENGFWPSHGGIPNPKDRVLDLAEVQALRNLLSWRIPKRRKGFGSYFDGDWADNVGGEGIGKGLLGKINKANSENEINQIINNHLSAIDNVKDVGIRHFIIDHAIDNTCGLCVPESAEEGWKIHPEAKPIFEYAKSKGVKISCYNGGGTPAPEVGLIVSSEIAFFPDSHQDWKVRNLDGTPKMHSFAQWKPFPLNCIACFEFAEWYTRLQIATIQKNNDFWWGWDALAAWQINSGPCYAENHDHLPGECSYARYRAMKRVMSKIREACPEIWLHHYWGVKHWGPFALTEVDTHENYYEYFMTKDSGIPNQFYFDHPSFQTDSLDHWNLSQWGPDDQLAWPSCQDMRLQYWFNYNERFLPCHMSFSQFDDRLVELVAAIASGGALIMVNKIRKENIPIFREWIQFAYDNADILQNTYLGLYGPPRRGGVDGWAHIRSDGGYVFLFNPNKDVLTVELPLNEDIGLAKKNEPFVVKRRIPRVKDILSINGNSLFSFGTILTFDVPGESFMVLEICHSEKEDNVEKWFPKRTKKPIKPFVSFTEYEEIKKSLPAPPSEVTNDVFINQRPFS